MVLDGFATLHDALAQAKPRHPPVASVAQRQALTPHDAFLLAQGRDDAKRYKIGIVVFGLGLALLIALKIRRSHRALTDKNGCLPTASLRSSISEYTAVQS